MADFLHLAEAIPYEVLTAMDGLIRKLFSKLLVN